ncbi:hypothetical protein J1605_019687 [Eschrichtius robustus]|uniref:Uncharacterized protein n=1 Tax=Eschrichtius robustus TaxID=9764 RepID=A0AB34HJN4_ESCRO|nr:hypothetical protein J1605_019687 [Eschrichtius robustus]
MRLPRCFILNKGRHVPPPRGLHGVTGKVTHLNPAQERRHAAQYPRWERCWEGKIGANSESVRAADVDSLGSCSNSQGASPSAATDKAGPGPRRPVAGLCSPLLRETRPPEATGYGPELTCRSNRAASACQPSAPSAARRSAGS